MLIEFTVGNYRSFQEVATFSMEATKLSARNKTVDTNAVVPMGNTPLLTSAAIYGANASGKSNLINALEFMRWFVLNSFREMQVTDRIPTERFRLSTDTDADPSYFQMVFLLNGQKYTYGFEVDGEKVVSEWLYFVKTTREAKLFEREGSEFQISTSFREGKGIEGRTRDNALFLSVAAQFNGTVASQILRWFDNLDILHGLSETWSNHSAVMNFHQRHQKEDVIQLLKSFDVGINDVQVEMTPALYAPSSDRSEGFRGVREEFVRDVPTIKTAHLKYDADHQPVGTELFDMHSQESDGTQKLFALAGPIVDALREGTILVVDELDARLHPTVTAEIIALFNNNATNPRHAQLIFTTHDTNLLDNKRFRRDQIWFTEKDQYGASHLYSLAEFRVRNDASYKKDYIQGRYGAVPFIGDMSRLFGGQNGEG